MMHTAADPQAARQLSAPVGPLVGGPRDRPTAGALPTDVDRFRELVWAPLAAADPNGRRWLAALAAFELLRHGAAEPIGVLHATSRSVAAMLGIAETTWCRNTRAGQSGYGPLLEAAGLLVRTDWDRYRLPAWQTLQNRAGDATLNGRFVYTHRPTFRGTVIRWRLTGVSLAALGAWSLLRYCHTRWDTAELALCDTAVARLLGVKAHTWAGWADQLAACRALERLPGPAAGWRLPLYFVLRTGRGCHDTLTATATGDARNEQVHARTAVQLHASSADPPAKPAAALCSTRAREDPGVDGEGQEQQPGDDVERTLERLAALAGDAWQQQQIRTSTTLGARCTTLLARTGWSPQRLAAELTRRELRTAAEPVRVLAYRARILLETAPAGDRPPPALAAPTAAARAPEGPEQHAPSVGASTGPQTPALGELDALDPPTRRGLLEAARARLRRIGLPRGGGDFADDHPLLRSEALNLLHQAAPPETDVTVPSPDTPGNRPRRRSAEPAVPAGETATQPPADEPAASDTRPGDDCQPTPGEPVADDVPAPSTSPAAQPETGHDAGQPARPPPRSPRPRPCRQPRRADLRHAEHGGQYGPRPSPPRETSPFSARNGASQNASRPRGRDPPAARREFGGQRFRGP